MSKIKMKDLCCEKSTTIKCYNCELYIYAAQIRELIKNDSHECNEKEISLRESELLIFKNTIIENCKQIEILKKKLDLKTKLILKEVMYFHKNTIEPLIVLNNSYLEILKNHRFLFSQIPKIEEISNTRISVKLVESYNSKLLIERYYPKVSIQDRQILIIGDNGYEQEQEIIKRGEERKGGEGKKEEENLSEEERKKLIECDIKEITSKSCSEKTDTMDLSNKIECYYPLIKRIYSWWNKDHCIKVIKEILVSNDKQFIFVCIS